jgi:hypothetical protein
MTDQKLPATWRVVLAFFLDLITSFTVFGYLIARLTGGLTENGFSLEGLPAILCFGLVIAYFLIMPSLGGRLWQRLLGARKL